MVEFNILAVEIHNVDDILPEDIDLIIYICHVEKTYRLVIMQHRI